MNGPISQMNSFQQAALNWHAMRFQMNPEQTMRLMTQQTTGGTNPIMAHSNNNNNNNGMGSMPTIILQPQIIQQSAQINQLLNAAMAAAVQSGSVPSLTSALTAAGMCGANPSQTAALAASSLFAATPSTTTGSPLIPSQHHLLSNNNSILKPLALDTPSSNAGLVDMDTFTKLSSTINNSLTNNLSSPNNNNISSSFKATNLSTSSANNLNNNSSSSPSSSSVSNSSNNSNHSTTTTTTTTVIPPSATNATPAMVRPHGSQGFTSQIKEFLEDEFRINPSATVQRRQELALATGLTPNQIKYWFGDRRKKEYKKTGIRPQSAPNGIRRRFPPEQRKVLEAEFEMDPDLEAERIESIAQATGLTGVQIRTWFRDNKKKLNKHAQNMANRLAAAANAPPPSSSS